MRLAGLDTSAATDLEESRPGRPLEWRRLGLALRRRRRSIVRAGGAGALIGLGLALTVAPARYEAETVLLWERTTQIAESTDESRRQLQTLVDSVKLARNLAEIRRRVPWKGSADELGARLEVKQASGSNVLRVRAWASRPIDAMVLARTTAEVFLDHRREVESARAQEKVKVFGELIAEARRQLLAAREEWDRFRRDNGFSDYDKDRLSAIEDAAELKTAAQRARADWEAENARAELFRSVARHEPARITAAEVELRADRKKLAEIDAERLSLGAALAETHPRALALHAEAEALRPLASSDRPGQLVERTLGRNPHRDFLMQGLSGASALREAAERRRSIFQELVGAAERRVAELSAVEGRASELLAVVRGAEAHVSELEILLGRARDVALRPDPGFRVLSPAELPERPSKSTRRWIALGAPLLFLTGSMAWAVWRGLVGLRLAAPAEIAFWGGAPVAATSMWPLWSAPLDDLVTDLHTLGFPWEGTLLLPLSEVEAPLIEALSMTVAPEEAHAVALSTGGPVTQASEVSVLRRKARVARRVLIVVQAARHSPARLARTAAALGRKRGLAFMLVGLEPELSDLPDRVGEVERFVVSPAPHTTGARHEGALGDAGPGASECGARGAARVS